MSANSSEEIDALQQRPKTLLSDKEQAEGNIAFVELVKERDRLIEEAKGRKRTTDATH